MVSPSLPGKGLPRSRAGCATQLAMVCAVQPNSRARLCGRPGGLHDLNDLSTNLRRARRLSSGHAPASRVSPLMSNVNPWRSGCGHCGLESPGSEAGISCLRSRHSSTLCTQILPIPCQLERALSGPTPERPAWRDLAIPVKTQSLKSPICAHIKTDGPASGNEELERGSGIVEGWLAAAA